MWGKKGRNKGGRGVAGERSRWTVVKESEER